jgi:hypothetical protein
VRRYRDQRGLPEIQPEAWGEAVCLFAFVVPTVGNEKQNTDTLQIGTPPLDHLRDVTISSISQPLRHPQVANGPPLQCMACSHQA